MISLAVCLIQPFDPNSTDPCVNRSYPCSLLPKEMNHPYMFPDEAPWTDDYYELKALRSRPNPDDEDDHSRYWCEENILEMEDALFFCV